MKKILGLDIFRGLAAILVFFFHYWTFYPDAPLGNIGGNFFSAGHLGVDIFFVLSGFLVSLSLFRYTNKTNPPSPPSQGGIASPCEGGLRGLKKYFSARFRRIIPLAIITTFLFYVAKQNFTPENFLDLLAHIFFVQGFFQDFYHGINPVMWTLSVEMLFYITLPVLYIFIAKKNFTKLLYISFFLVLLSFFWRGIVFYFFPESSAQEKIFLSEQLWGRFDQFFLGMVLAVLVFKEKKFFHNTFFIAPIFIGISLLIYSFITFANLGSSFREILWMQIFLHSLVGLGFFLFLLGFLGLQKNNPPSPPSQGGITSPCEGGLRGLFFSSLLFLGKISYGIYLFHFPILSQVSKIFPASPLLGFSISLILTLLISWLSWEFFEKKFLVRKKK